MEDFKDLALGLATGLALFLGYLSLDLYSVYKTRKELDKKSRQKLMLPPERETPKPVVKERERPRKHVPPVVAVSLDVNPAEVPSIAKSEGPEVPSVRERFPEEVKSPKVAIEKPVDKPKSERQLIYEDLLKNF
jgi:hypothetical protein